VLTGCGSQTAATSPAKHHAQSGTVKQATAAVGPLWLHAILSERHFAINSTSYTRSIATTR
jgi:hypothetical protein